MNKSHLPSSRIMIILALISLNLWACRQKKILLQPETAPSVQVIDNEIYKVLDKGTKIEILADGFTWSEGPLWLSTLQKLIFTDVPENTIYSWDAKHGKQVYLKPSGYTILNPNGGTEGANGLILDHNGNLIICQHGNRSVAKMLAPLSAPKPNFEYLAQKYDSKLFNSPNDLCLSRSGDMYFTDPPYGLPKQDNDPIKELTFNGVYLLKKNGTLILLDSTLTRPNGIALAKDEKYMIVANSDEKNAIWVKYMLDDDKNIISKSVFADMTHLVATQKGLPDGLKIHKKGYIFATGPGGVLIFHPDGRHLGTINTGQATANCAFDEIESYLYMTAHKYLMRIKIK